MPPITFASLSTRAKENFRIIQSGIDRGLTNKRVNQLIVDRQGRGLRNQELGRATNLARGVVQTATTFKNVRRDRIPNVMNWEIIPGRIPSDNQFQSDFEVTWRDANGNEGKTLLTVGTNEFDLTREMWEEKAREAWEKGVEDQRYGGITFVSASPKDRPRRTY